MTSGLMQRLCDLVLANFKELKKLIHQIGLNGLLMIQVGLMSSKNLVTV